MTHVVNHKIVLISINTDEYYAIIFYTHSFFSNGSIINTVDVSFASSSVPNDTQIAEVLISASSNITAFNIDTSSISINGTRKNHLALPHFNFKYSLNVSLTCKSFLTYRNFKCSEPPDQPHHSIAPCARVMAAFKPALRLGLTPL